MLQNKLVPNFQKDFTCKSMKAPHHISSLIVPKNDLNMYNSYKNRSFNYLVNLSMFVHLIKSRNFKKRNHRIPDKYKLTQ